MPLFFKTVSGSALLAIVALLALQAFPHTGIFLMMFGGAFLTGLLVHVFLVGLAAEAFLGRIPRALAAIPVIAYGSYYALYVHQTIEIHRKSAQLQQENSGKVFDFDANFYSLVTPAAEQLVTQYAIPVVYQPNKNYSPEKHLSFRLLRRDQCGDIPIDSRHRIVKLGVSTGGSLVRGVCQLGFPEDPPKKVITAIKRGDEEVWKRKWDFGEQSTDILVDGKVVGSFKTASIWRLPIWPTAAIGCGLISGGTPAWKCFADFVRTHTEIDTIPANVDHAKYGAPESVMLGIPRYTPADLAVFRGDNRNDEALARIAEESKRVENDSFAILQQIVDGQSPAIPFNLGYSLALDPGRLVPFAEPMAKRLRELVGNADGRNRNQIEPLETALAALPVSAFAPVSDTIFDVVRQNEGWKRFSRLYLRAAESGVKTLAYYESDFMSGETRGFLRFLPVLAICRIGQASPEVVAEMKQRFIATSSDDHYQSALLVALLSLGEEPFIKNNVPVKPGGNYRGWAEAVLSGNGKTAIGPNNCMAKEWGNTSYIGAVMAPALPLNRGKWVVQSQT